MLRVVLILIGVMLLLRVCGFIGGDGKNRLVRLEDLDIREKEKLLVGMWAAHPADCGRVDQFPKNDIIIGFVHVGEKRSIQDYVYWNADRIFDMFIRRPDGKQKVCRTVGFESSDDEIYELQAFSCDGNGNLAAPVFKIPFSLDSPDRITYAYHTSLRKCEARSKLLRK